MNPDLIKELQEDAEYQNWLDKQENYAQEQEQPEDFVIDLLGGSEDHHNKARKIISDALKKI